MSTDTSDQYLEILKIIHAIYLTNGGIWFGNNDHVEKDIIISRKVLLHERLIPLCMVQIHRVVHDLVNWTAFSITSFTLLNQQHIGSVWKSIDKKVFPKNISVKVHRQLCRLLITRNINLLHIIYFVLKNYLKYFVYME